MKGCKHKKVTIQVVEVLHLGVGDLRTVKSEYATTKKPAPNVKNVKSLSMFVSDFLFFAEAFHAYTQECKYTHTCACVKLHC